MSGGRPELDLLVRGGTVVTAGATFTADVGIAAGKVVRLGDGAPARQVIDATGKLVLPGGLDMHVHLTPAVVAEGTFAWADDFVTGSRAAAAGGVTTLGNMTFPRPGEALVAALDGAAREVAARSLVDVVLHPVLTEAGLASAEVMEELAARGHTSFKFFMSLAGFEEDPAGYARAMHLAAGAGVLPMVHCEDAALTSYLGARLAADGMSEPSAYPVLRPVYAEVAATARAIALARAASAPLYLVHLSSRDALAVARDARAHGLPVLVETRPDYLFLTQERALGPDGVLYAGSPPLRAAEDSEALWAGLRDGAIQTCCSDHAPWSRAEKLAADSAVEVKNGTAALETMLPLLFSEGVRKRRLSLEQFVALTSTNAARIFGLYPRKGTVAIGADADLVVWNPDARRVVRAGELHGNADYSVYEGWEVQGWPEYTISRGEVVFAAGAFPAPPGRGQVVPRARVTAASIG